MRSDNGSNVTKRATLALATCPQNFFLINMKRKIGLADFTSKA